MSVLADRADQMLGSYERADWMFYKNNEVERAGWMFRHSTSNICITIRIKGDIVL